MNRRGFQQRFKTAKSQRGISLLIALVALAAISLATLALVRSIDTGSLLLGNLGFKQDATAAADQGTRLATTWLTENSANLSTDAIPSGYYASTTTTVDATGQQLPSVVERVLIDWDNNNCNSATVGACTLKSSVPVNVGGNEIQYVIFRLCSLAGDYNMSTNSCAKPIANSTATAAKKGELNYSDPLRFSSTAGPYYRIVVRVRGARSTTSFTEAIVHF